MPISVSYPGVYIEEIPSGVHSISGVATSIAAFVGWSDQGPVDQATLVQSWSDFASQFGGLDTRSFLGYSVNQFFQNGGQQAYIVRLAGPDAVTGTLMVSGIPFDAQNPGGWANQYAVAIKSRADGSGRFQVLVYSIPPGSPSASVSSGSSGSGPSGSMGSSSGSGGPSSGSGLLGTSGSGGPSSGSGIPASVIPGNWTVVESFENLSLSPSDPQSRYFVSVIADGSNFIVVDPSFNPASANVSQLPSAGNVAFVQFGNGYDGTPLYPGSAAFHTALNADNSGTGGIHLLDVVTIFNLLCVPGETDGPTISDLQQYCYTQRAFYIVDSPQGFTTDNLITSGPVGSDDSQGLITGQYSINSAYYYPWVQAPDPLQQGRVTSFPPCGFVAGLYAATDASRGVWKAPAGTTVSLTGVSGLATTLTDLQNGSLNTQAVNCLRNFPVYGNVLWGARTLQGNDEAGSEWQYVPIRRLALYLESSLFQGTQWVVFEPNDTPLWTQIRLNINSFMQGLFLQGAFQGSTPQQAYFVKCDADINPQSSIDQGIVNIQVGFAPLYPAEFVVIQIQQMAGQG
jgi:phage tail sheath protein FI